MFLDWGKEMYNLLEEKWITVQSNKETSKVSLIELLEKAHEITDIIDNPIVRVSILRVALAALYKQYQIKTPTQWIDLWNKGKFDIVLDKKKFELFNDKNPFYQSVGVSGQKNVFTIKPHLGGNNAIFFDDPQRLYSMTYEESAKWLITHQMWAVCMSPTNLCIRDSVLTRGVVLIIEGRNLFETLMLNLLCGEHLGDPVWERTKNTGLLDLLTWRSRKIKLVPDNGVVRMINYMGGDQVLDVDDPMLVYVVRKGKKFKLKLNYEKQLWRDCDALFTEENSLALKQLYALYNNDHVSEVANDKFKKLKKRFSIVGMIITNTAKIQHYVSQTFPVPEMLFDPDKNITKKGEIKSVLQYAEKLSWTIRSTFLKQMNIKAEQRRIVIDNYLMEYWSSLEVPFMNYLRDVFNSEQLIDLCFKIADKIISKIVSDYWNEDSFKFNQRCKEAFFKIKGGKVDGS